MNVLPQQSVTAFAVGEHSPVADYDQFASIYDAYFGEYARRVVPVLQRLVLASLPRSARVLDVCCGTGQLAAALVERGFAVSGVDGSAEMLRVAQRNAPQAEFLLDDVRVFRQSESFDAAVSTYDSINHILETADLQATFTNVYNALRPGGRFVFDMNMEEGYRCRWGGTLRGSDNGRAFVIRAIYSPETKLGRNVVTWLDVEPAAAAQITFVERCYTEQEVCSGLTETGFHGIEVYDGHRDLGLVGEIGRSFFVCKKSPRAFPCTESDPFGVASRQRLRGIPTCVDDALWPGEPSPPEIGIGNRRLLAVEEVLSTLPPEPYQLLKGEAARFAWFIPSDMVLGQVHPFRAMVDRPEAEAGSGPWARVVYLSPLLEQQEWAVVVTVVVHELAHLILGHQLHDLDREAYEHQEEAVRHAVREWGFQVEADRADEHLRNQAFNRLLPESHRGIRPAGPRTVK